MNSSNTPFDATIDAERMLEGVMKRMRWSMGDRDRVAAFIESVVAREINGRRRPTRRHSLCKPVTIRGTKYDSIKEAAAALDVHVTTIHKAQTRDDLNNVGHF